MSLIKDDYLECLFRGYGHSNKWICHGCISNYALSDYIKEKGETHSCSYCKSRKKSILLEDLMLPIMDGISFLYSHAVDELPVERGEYIGSTYNTEDLFEETLSDEIGASSEGIIADIISLIGDEIWCDANPFEESEEEVAFDQWQRFCKLVKEKMRYVFFEAKADDGCGSSPMDILNYISSSIKEIGLTTTINKNTKMYRCRMSKEEKYYSALSDFCPPPAEIAVAGRMNAQGIPVLYLTLEPETAIEEVDSSEKQYASIASFRVESSFTVLDLTKLNNIKTPSIFDAEGRTKISSIHFLKRFNEQISQRVSIEQIDYVPTQIVTEYFRFLYGNATKQYQGILYNSAKRENGKCLALFFSREDVLNGKHGIHIIPKQTQYYRKSYQWVSEEEKARMMCVKAIIEELGKKTLPEISEETGLSKADTAKILKILQNQGILEQKVASINSSYVFQ